MSDFIKEFWEEQANKFGSSPDASWQDNFAIDLEIDTIGKNIDKGDVVLDVGCANGFASFRQLESRKPKKIFGIDYAENMIEYAQRVRNEYPEKDKLEFKVGNAMDIPFNDSSFDVVYTTRVLINLPNWEKQKKAIDECLRVCRKGGKVIFSEAFYEPLTLLNSMRLLLDLPPLVEHDFNRYLKKNKLEEYLHDKNLQFECVDFSSIYYLGSRFLRELVTDPSEYPGYTNPINQIFYDIETEYSGGGFGIQQAYIVRL